MQLNSAVLVITALFGTLLLPCRCETSKACSASEPNSATALLQAARRDATSIEGLLEVATNSTGNVNPSGAAAPLDEQGYAAVADRCCRAEMRQFIQRSIQQLNLEVCNVYGLEGITPYHSCEKGPQTFAKLTADLLSDSTSRCTWVAQIGNCKARPADCPDFPNSPAPADCGCSRSRAAKVDFSGGPPIVTENNLGGTGPTTGPEEIRYSNVGTSDTGVRFDVVVTALTPYAKNPNILNGVYADTKLKDFGRFGLTTPTAAGLVTDYKFSFMQPGTNTPVMLNEIHITCFDLDGEAGANGNEVMSSKGYKGYSTDINTQLLASRLSDGRTKFTSTVQSVLGPNNGPNNLSTEERENAVMYFYEKVSSVEITWGLEGHQGGRGMAFSFQSSLDDRCGP